MKQKEQILKEQMCVQIRPNLSCVDVTCFRAATLLRTTATAESVRDLARLPLGRRRQVRVRVCVYVCVLRRRWVGDASRLCVTVGCAQRGTEDQDRNRLS